MASQTQADANKLFEGRPPPLPGKEVPAAIKKEIKALSSSDHAAVAKAAAGLFMLSSRSEAAPYLGPAVPLLVPLLASDDAHVKKNACAALTSIASVNEALRAKVTSAQGVASGLVGLLRASGNDTGVQLNAASALSTIAQETGAARAVVLAEGAEALVDIIRPEATVELQEAAADALCALAAEESLRQHLGEKGVVQALASLLGSPSAEVKVRALLGLGMLCGANAERQAYLAGVDGAVSSLVAVMRSPDSDIKSIAREVFMSLATNPTLRPAVEEQLRATKE